MIVSILDDLISIVGGGGDPAVNGELAGGGAALAPVIELGWELPGLLRFRFWFWTSSRAVCCLSWLESLLV